MYRPRDSLLVFVFSGLMFPTLATAALAVPIWLPWRMAGIRPQPARLFVGLAASAVFLVRSWGAYAATFGASRTQSAGAGVLVIVLLRLLPGLVLFTG